jgi:uncharacterized protein (TIGR02246 family)
MSAISRLVLAALLVLVPVYAFADPAKEAEGLFAQWKAAYDANDNVAVAKLYATDAILHGTRSRDLTIGREAITKYFTVVVGTGNKVEFRERELKVPNDQTILVVGFNDFMRNKNGQLTPEPARFTMVLSKRGNDWFIAHHHSSLRPPPKQ